MQDPSVSGWRSHRTETVLLSPVVLLAEAVAVVLLTGVLTCIIVLGVAAPGSG